MVYRSFIVWGAGTTVLLLIFLIFVLAGWPGHADRCVSDVPNTCYCESFVTADIGLPGVRQKVNTWFNLYSILSSGLVALVVFLDRQGGTSSRNLMRDDTLVADLYVFVVLFLGLGSMWFHASLMSWGGNMDGVSMYAYAAFLPLYSLHRKFIPSPVFFWIAYPVTVLVFSGLHVALTPSFGLTSLFLIGILVLAYLAIEVAIWVRTGQVMQGRLGTTLLWLGAVAAIIAATLFWIFSQTGGALCNPTSAFQPHGLLWHPLAGLMAVLLYFYWRAAND